jgi:hypothetical protein
MHAAIAENKLIAAAFQELLPQQIIFSLKWTNPALSYVTISSRRQN